MQGSSVEDVSPPVPAGWPPRPAAGASGPPLSPR
jgi:hypothetical protein